MSDLEDFDRPTSVQMTVEVNSEGNTTSARDATNDNGAANNSTVVAPGTPITAATLKSVEFSFLDNKNICCGLCGEIVPYDQLMSDHLPNAHPEVLADTSTTMEEIPYEQWLQEKLQNEKRSIESGFKLTAYRSAARAPKQPPAPRPTRPARRVSAIRVNPREMTVVQLDQALRKKMFEKLGRQVPVSLIDKLHARCGLCSAIISLNKKFEIVHLVRHFNCWHPTVHPCAGSWHARQPTKQGAKPLTLHDFAVIDTGSGGPDTLQCIWCGMFVESAALAQHFAEVHPDDVEVPKCNLCMQELIINARFQEKFQVDFEITLPDEHHMRCGECRINFSTESSLDRHIVKRHIEGVPGDLEQDASSDVDDPTLEEIGPEAFANSRMTLGKRRRPKRQFIMPALRQAVPLESEYVEPIAECHWKCKVCEGDIYGAVISAAAIKHFKIRHPEQVDNMQYELCKARLEKISDGCMEFIHPQLIECLLCQQSFNLHQPFNMCRAIRHLKAKHPNLMPEYAGMSNRDDGGGYYADDADLDASGAFAGMNPYLSPDEINAVPSPPPPIVKMPRLDHTAAALPPTTDLELVEGAVASNGGQPVYILVATDEAQQQIVQQVIAAGGKLDVDTGDGE